MRWTLVSMLCVLNGCAHYSVASASSRVGVATITTPTHLNIDEAQLTRLLVDELTARGFDAQWTSSGDVRLVCTLDADSAFESSEGAMASMRGSCEVVESHRTRTIDSQAQRVVAGDRNHANNVTARAVALLLAREFDATMRETR